MQKFRLTFQYPLDITRVAVAIRLAQAAAATAMGIPRYPNMATSLYTSIRFMERDNVASISTLRGF